jgi:hypothetical protein
MKNTVFASFENEYNDHCVDIFERPDGSFGYEEFRRDVEDCGAWQSLGRYSQHVFGSKPLALAAANKSVQWLTENEIWQRYLPHHHPTSEVP